MKQETRDLVTEFGFGVVTLDLAQNFFPGPVTTIVVFVGTACLTYGVVYKYWAKYKAKRGHRS